MKCTKIVLAILLNLCYNNTIKRIDHFYECVHFNKEGFTMKKTRTTEHVIRNVLPGSIAQELEIEPGDVLLSIGGEKVEDVFDYHYLPLF